MTTLADCTDLPIKSLRIGRDSATNLSRGVCYVEMNSVSDAMFLHNRLLGEPPTIDDRLVGVSYHRSQQNSAPANVGPGGSSAASAAMAAAQWSHQGKEQHQGGAMSDEEIEKMAKSAAEMYGKTAEEKAHYLEYYRNYYKNGGDSSASTAPAADKTENDKELGKVTVSGVEYKKYRKFEA